MKTGYSKVSENGLQRPHPARPTPEEPDLSKDLRLNPNHDGTRCFAISITIGLAVNTSP
jgi:hypothetical protein